MTQAARIVQFPERRHDGEVWEPWVDEATIAHHFGVDARTIRRWRLKRNMPSKLIGGSRRYKIGACERWHDEEAA